MAADTPAPISLPKRVTQPFPENTDTCDGKSLSRELETGWFTFGFAVESTASSEGQGRKSHKG